MTSSDAILKIIKEKNKDPWWQKSEKKVVGVYGKMFHPSNLDNLTKEDFKSFLLSKNNLHWDGIHRQGNIITSDMPKLIRFLKYLLNESVPLQQRLSTGFIDKGGYWIKGIGKAVMSAILLVVYPKKYGVWNSRSEAALKKLGLFPKFSPKDNFATKYQKINDILNELATKYSATLWQLDGILGEISGFGPFAFEKAPSQEEVVEEEAEEHGITDLANFGMESHLEDFLISNWSKTIYGKKYDLIYDEGDLQSQQYQTPVGIIDILAISKDKKEYLVIELKKGRSSDAVVGQILRYMSWVRENIGNGKSVKGVIVTLEIDDKLKYSLKGLPNITLYTYQVNFKLLKEAV